MPHHLRPVAEPYILLGDLAIIGFFFVGGIVFFEKLERTLGAVISTPLRFWEYLAAKLTVLLGIIGAQVATSGPVHRPGAVGQQQAQPRDTARAHRARTGQAQHDLVDQTHRGCDG